VKRSLWTGCCSGSWPRWFRWENFWEPCYCIPPDCGDILWYSISEHGSERRRI